MLPLFILGHFSHHVMTAITVPLIPFIRSAFNLDYTASGLVVSAFTLAYGIGQLPAGWLADRIEPRRLMTIGISGVALAGVLVGLSNGYAMMIVCLVLMGILAGGYHPSAPPLINASVRPENLGKALGFHNIGGGASYFIAPLLAVTIANAWGWRSAYIWLSVPMILFGALFYLLLGRRIAREKAAPARQERDGQARLRPGQIRRLVIFLILTTFTSAVLTSMVSFIPLLMVDHYGMSKEMAGAAFSIMYTAAFWASPLSGYLSDRLGSVRVILAVCGLGGLVLYLMTALPYGWWLLAPLIMMGAVIYARMSASENFIIDQTPVGSRSTVLGIYYFTGMEGGGVLTPAVGYVIDQYGFASAFTLAGVFLIAVTLLCGLGLRESRR
jgi:MFS family permease